MSLKNFDKESKNIDLGNYNSLFEMEVSGKIFLILTTEDGEILKFTSNTPEFIANEKNIFDALSNVGTNVGTNNTNKIDAPKLLVSGIYEIISKMDKIKNKIRIFPFKIEGLYLIFAEDITENLLVEELLNQRIETLSMYLEFAPVFFVVLDKDGNIDYINEWALNALGYRFQEVIGKNWFEIFIPKDIREEILAVFRKIMNGEIKLLQTYENEIVTKNGKVLDILWESKLLLKNGVPSGTISVGVDITDKKTRDFEEEVTLSILNAFSESDYHLSISKIGNILRTKCNVVAAKAKIKTAEETVVFDFMENVQNDIDNDIDFESIKDKDNENIIEKSVKYEEKEIMLSLSFTSLPKYATNQSIDNIMNTLLSFLDRVYYIQKLEEASFKDPLTGLYNRRYFMLMLKNEIKRVKRYNYYSSVVMIDLDGLKEINDTLGHDKGDLAIKGIANAIISNIRTTDVGARFGGDEFVILLPHTSKENVENIIKRMRAFVKRYVTERDLKFEIKFSAGYTIINKGDDDEGISILKRADELLYKAKKIGKNQTFGEELEKENT